MTVRGLGEFTLRISWGHDIDEPDVCIPLLADPADPYSWVSDESREWIRQRFENECEAVGTMWAMVQRTEFVSLDDELVAMMIAACAEG